MNPVPSKSKRSTMACVHCRDRKVKCDNTNDGQPCDRCRKQSKTCRYEPVNPTTETSSSTSTIQSGDSAITPDMPIMMVYEPPPSNPTPPQDWPNQEPYIDPTLREGYPPESSQPRPVRPYDPIPTAPALYQPPHAAVHPYQWPTAPFPHAHPTHHQYSFAQNQNFHSPGYWPPQPMDPRLNMSYASVANVPLNTADTVLRNEPDGGQDEDGTPNLNQ